MENETGIIRIIKSRIIALNREIADARSKLADKEKELALAKIILHAVSDKETESR
jgi:hypothetical protein